MNPVILPFLSATEFNFELNLDHAAPVNSTLTLKHQGNALASCHLGSGEWFTISAAVDGSGRLSLIYAVNAGNPLPGAGTYSLRADQANFALKIRNTANGGAPYVIGIGTGDIRLGDNTMMTNTDVLLNISNIAPSMNNAFMASLDFVMNTFIVKLAYPTANYNACSGASPFFPQSSCLTPSIPTAGKWYNP